LTVEEIETVWKWLGSDALYLEASDILKLQLLIGARCGEVAGLRTGEINRQKWIWTLPAAHSKNGRLRVTPIVGVAHEILESGSQASRRDPYFCLRRAWS
jgi:integrase